MVIAFLVGFFDQYVQPVHRRSGEPAGRDRRRQPALETGAARVLGSVQRAGRRGQGAARRGGDRRAQRAARAASVPAARRRRRSARLSVCGAGQLSLKLGRFGAFVGCSNYPDCRCHQAPGESTAAAREEGEIKERVLGADPDTGEEIRLKRGPYGPYVQRGAGEGAKRSSLPPNLASDQLDLPTALKLLMLPRELGRHPETGQPIEVGINRYGPYIKHDRFVRLGPEDDV